MTNRIPQHLSSTWEHYTPIEVVEAARQTLGAFDLDPASCEDANKRVKASRFLTVSDDGLQDGVPWRGRVFLNPPGGAFVLKEQDQLRVQQSLPKAKAKARIEQLKADNRALTERWGTKSRACAWWRKLVEEFDAGRVRSAVFVGFTLEILRSSQGGKWAEPFDFARCFPRERLHFDGADPTHGNVIVYLGGHDRRFRACFEQFGRVVR